MQPERPQNRHALFAWIASAILVLLPSYTGLSAAHISAAADFTNNIQPILEKYCFDCHADGASKGGVTFDDFKSEDGLLSNRDLWWKVLKNLRAGMMPPSKKPRPTAEQQEQIAQWIKRSVFNSDPAHPDPGRVTVRRLNRAEYRNTIRDLLGIDFDTGTEFPPDDTGYGFDNIGDVLTLPPMLLEKYLLAANRVVGQAVPTTSRVVKESIVWGTSFEGSDDSKDQPGSRRRRGMLLSYYRPASVSNTFATEFSGKYTLLVDLVVRERYVDNVFDYNKCRLIFKVDGVERLRHDYSWEGGKPFHYEMEQDWAAGNHELSFELQPLTPGEKQTRTLSLQIASVTVRGPMAKEHWVQPANYARFFPREIPADGTARQRYARELLKGFARKAFRRPVDDSTIDRLASIAEATYSQPGKAFEAGIAEGMVAVLASPRFLFLEERTSASDAKEPDRLIDEYSLASRLSYFLWSSMPDAELERLADQGRLRENLAAQVDRMLKDRRSQAFVRDFTGQWLRARDIEIVPLEPRFILAREDKFDPEADRNRKRFRELNEKPDNQLSQEEREELTKIRAGFRRSFGRPLRAMMNEELRASMRMETEMTFDYVLRENRSLLELLDSDYTFLNEALARHYGMTNVVGEEMRRVTLPPGSPRGGILTQGTVLAATANPTRTSPVKRGLFILDNVLGIAPPPPPANIPPLEDATRNVTNRVPSLRETLAAHRENPMCSSCHNRMDPLGLALENFNAMGMWRDEEYGQPIDATGKLATGEEFHDVQELKAILVHNHSREFYRTITEKMLTYALGRGLEYYDVETVDQIVAAIEESGGRPSALMSGIVNSAPFQKARTGQTATEQIRTTSTSIEAQGADKKG